MHVTYHPSQSFVPTRRRIRPHEQFLVIGHICVGSPYLRPIDDQHIAANSCMSLDAGKIRSRVGLRESLAPDRLALQNSRQMKRPLRLAPSSDQRGTGMRESDEQRAANGRIGASTLLVPNELFIERQATAAIRLRPGNSRPTAFILPTLPAQIEFAQFRSRQGPLDARNIGSQPVANFRAKRLLFDGGLEPHVGTMVIIDSSFQLVR